MSQNIIDKYKKDYGGNIAWYICASFYGIALFMRTSINSLSPVLHQEYALSYPDIAIIASCFYLSYFLVQLPAGVIVDAVGVKRTLQVGIILSGLGTLLFGLSNSFLVLAISRVIQGIGFGVAFIAGLKCTSLYYDGSLYTGKLAVLQVFCSLGAIASSYPLVQALSAYSISTICFLIASILLVMFALVNLFVPAEEEILSSVDLFKEIMKGIQTVLSDRQIMLNCLYSFFIYGTTAVFIDLYALAYFENISMYTNEIVSKACMSACIGMAIGGLIWGELQKRYVGKEVMLLQIAALMSVVSGYVLLYVPMHEIALLAVTFVFASMQSGHILNFTLVKGHTTRENEGKVNSILNSVFPLSGFIFQTASSVLLGYNAGIYSSNAEVWQVSMSIVVVLAIISFIVSLMLKPIEQKGSTS